MLDPRWMKVMRDLWSNRMRTVLVVLSIAVGVFAVGTVQHLRSVVLDGMQAAYDESNAAQATIFAGGLDEAMLDTLRRMPEVADAEGRSSLSVNVEVAPDKWESLNVTMIHDFEDIRLNYLIPMTSLDSHPEFNAAQTHWPDRDEIILERSALDADGALPAGVAVGSPLVVETESGKQRTLIVTGAVYDANGFPAAFTGTGSGYVTPETFERLGGSPTYSQVGIRVVGTPEQLRDEAYITAIANKAADKIELSGRTVQRVQVFRPGRLPLQDLFDAIALLLTPLGLLALLLSGFLVINTISALMSQQTRQIGIMKAVGADRNQITGMYLSAVLSYSVLALLVAIPLTLYVAGGIAQFLGGFINVAFPRWVLPFNVLLLQIFVGILIPILAALWPIARGTKISVREALSEYGLGRGHFGTDRFSRFLGHVRGMSRPVQISLRNTFRRRARLILTLVTLVLGGMIFMTVGSVRQSMGNLIESGIAYNQFDIQIEFGRPYRQAQIEQIVRSVPGVKDVEMWGSGSATPIHADGTEGDPLLLTALPPESEMVEPTLQEGRWLLPDDENAIVISQKVLANEPDLKVGDTIVLKINGDERPWVIVGIAQVLSGPPTIVPAFVHDHYFARVTQQVDKATSVQLTVDNPDADNVAAMVETISTALEDQGLEVGNTFTIAQLRRFSGIFFDIIIYLLMAMGVLIASVGALGLMGTMSTNVLERTREIGVMRAIGASNGAIQRIVIVEGVIIGMLSWFIGAMLAFPAGWGLSSAVGAILFQTALPYSFSAGGVFTWLAIVAVLAIVASSLPAWNASRLTVREVLAYE
ncbi:MAG: FtsX-like permease family protein [Caldilineaceae bacterium]|nr:FtsX-like permease family protein [Caldilineaceae bacterium]